MTIDITHLQKIEASRVNVTLVTLMRIADGLGVPIRDLFADVPRRENVRRR